MKDLNNIYNDYKDNYNLKIKEEARLFKKEGKNEMINKNKNVDLSSIIKISKKYNLIKYLNKRNIFLYSLLIIFLISLFAYIMTICLWYSFLRQDSMLYLWVNRRHELYTEANGFMNNLLLMIYSNQTFNELTGEEINNYISLIYSKLTSLYQVYKYKKSLLKLIILEENVIDYDCSLFHKNLENKIFEELKDKFVNEQEKLFNTMNILCYISNALIFKNDKTIFLQLFSKVKDIMENFPNGEYKDIIQYISYYFIARFEITFLTIYIYLMDISFDNIEIALLNINNKYKDTIITFGITYLLLIIILVFIIYFVYIKNINNDCNKFIQARKIFKVCNTNE